MDSHQDGMESDQPLKDVTSEAAPAGYSADGGNDEPVARRCYFNSPDQNAEFQFCDNQVHTTKYTAASFVPAFFFSEFRKAANFYFLVMCVLTSFREISPITNVTTILPLSIVLSVAGLKELHDDWGRLKQDREVNNSHVNVLISDEFRKMKWSNIRVGDIVELTADQAVPADMILLSSSEDESLAYVETSQLDGETNLKIRESFPETAGMQSVDELSRISGYLEYEHPNNRLYNFDGTMHWNGKKIPIGVSSILLRGCILRNTHRAFGFVVFTGHETKIMKNRTPTPFKRTQVEHFMNNNMYMIFAIQFVLCTLCAIGSTVWTRSHDPGLFEASQWKGAWYLEEVDNISFQGFKNFFTFIIIFNTMVPISLYVTIEMVKVGGAILVNNDVKMYFPKTNTPAQVRTTSLLEELGQISYVFSDKTGTLTQNVMIFRKCCVDGQRFGDIDEQNRVEVDEEEDKFDGAEYQQVCKKPSGDQHAQRVRDFALLLALCHTVIAEKDEETGKLVYQASSPDEAALVDGARSMGATFINRVSDRLIVDAWGKREQWELLNVLEFNSTRKRMSVIVRSPEGRIVLMTKGADSVIFERVPGNHRLREGLLDDLQTYAADGLRTLCLAQRELSQAEYNDWNSRYEAAATSLTDRDVKVDECAEEIEKNLDLLGSTAIEDKLQDGVPATLVQLARGGMKVWMLTGDKQETAISIGFSCQLLNDEMELAVLNGGSVQEVEKQMVSAEAAFANKEADGKKYTAIVIDGSSLSHALGAQLREKFYDLAKDCKAVICCRVSPLQKAQVVQLVKDRTTSITLAIGDGANDCSMIQAAHVGIGISGLEGMQAVQASDYAIAQFRYLERLLLVHGRWWYKRISKLILYFFYKNMAMTMCGLYFSLQNGFSGQNYFEQYTQSAYNVLFTSLPVIVLGLLEQDVDQESVLGNPELYRHGIESKSFDLKKFWWFMFGGFYHAAVCYFFPVTVFSTGQTSDGVIAGQWAASNLSYTCIIFTVTLRIALITSYWTWLHHIVTWGSVVVWFAFALIIGTEGFMNISPESFGVMAEIGAYPAYWFTAILCPVICLMPEFALKYVKRTYLPEPFHIVQEWGKGHGHADSRRTPSELVVDRRKSMRAAAVDDRRRSTFHTARGEQLNTGYNYDAPVRGELAMRGLTNVLRVFTKLPKGMITASKKAGAKVVEVGQRTGAAMADATKRVFRSTSDAERR